MVSLEIQKIIIALLVIMSMTFIYNVLTEPKVLPYMAEGFSPLLPTLVDSPGTILQYYPKLDPTGKLGTKDSDQLWWHYPTFKVGSYSQITNNIKYPNNPDVGQCQPISMCNVLYGDRQEKTNYYEASVPPEPGKLRVGFFTTNTPPFF
jgi:hypothetical protein